MGGGKASDRDLGLAYFQMANHGDQAAGTSGDGVAASRLSASVASTPDPDLHTALGFLAHLSGDRQTAMREYQASAPRRIRRTQWRLETCAILEARAGDTKAAITRLQAISQNDPGETTASMDLAMIECAIGDPQAATTALTSSAGILAR